MGIYSMRIYKIILLIRLILLAIAFIASCILIAFEIKNYHLNKEFEKKQKEIFESYKNDQPKTFSCTTGKVTYRDNNGTIVITCD